MKNKIILGVCMLLAVVFAECMRETHTFRVTHYHIRSRKLKNLKRERKVIVLSDLHNYSYGENNQKLLDAIRQEKPDMIWIAGDMLVGKRGVSAAAAEKFVGELPKICKTYYGNGNHEQRMKEEPERYGNVYAEYKKRLVQKGVRFLENEKAHVVWDGQTVQIYGLEIPQHCYAKMQKLSLSQEEIEQRIGHAEQEAYEVLIAHNPVFAPDYMKWGADLIVSGHLHGGVVRIPYLGGIVTPQMKLFPKYSGEMTVEGEKTVVVSKGLGVHTIKFRLFNPAEMIVLHINKEV